jgi:hypothetical protein
LIRPLDSATCKGKIFPLPAFTLKKFRKLTKGIADSSIFMKTAKQLCFYQIFLRKHNNTYTFPSDQNLALFPDKEHAGHQIPPSRRTATASPTITLGNQWENKKVDLYLG